MIALKKLILIFTLSFSALLIQAQRGSSYPYISGDTFRAIADHIYDEENTIPDTSRIKTADIIFVKGDLLDTFITNILPHISVGIIIIIHNSDENITEKYLDFLNKPQIIAVFAQNIDSFAHPKLFNIPIGIANKQWDHGNVDIFSKEIKRSKKKQPYEKKLLYMNFSINTHPSRKKVYKLFKNATYCTVSQPTNLSIYLRELSEHIFTLSPRGNGLDCHRTWEALLMGSIPIVITSSLDPLYENLPVLIINDWDEIYEEFLILKYHEIKNKNYNFDKIYFDYWLNKIKETQANFLRN